MYVELEQAPQDDLRGGVPYAGYITTLPLLAPDTLSPPSLTLPIVAVVLQLFSFMSDSSKPNLRA